MTILFVLHIRALFFVIVIITYFWIRYNISITFINFKLNHYIPVSVGLTGMNSWTLLIVLWCLATFGIASLWSNDGSVEDDSRKLMYGENLVYLTVGSKIHNDKTLKEIKETLKITNVLCVDVCKESDTINDVRKFWELGHLDGPVLIVVPAVEKLAANERKQLDFVYRITDSSSEFASLIVLLVVEMSGLPAEQSLEAADSVPPAERLFVDGMKLALADALNEDSVYFNGHAFIGRVSQASFERLYESMELKTMGCIPSQQHGQLLHTYDHIDICSSWSDVHSQTSTHSDTTLPFDKSVVSVIAQNPILVVISVVIGSIVLIILYQLPKERENSYSPSSSNTQYSSTRSSGNGRGSVPACLVQSASSELYSYGIKQDNSSRIGKIGGMDNRSLPITPVCGTSNGIDKEVDESKKRSPPNVGVAKPRPSSDSKTVSRSMRRHSHNTQESSHTACDVSDTHIVEHDYPTRSKGNRCSATF